MNMFQKFLVSDPQLDNSFLSQFPRLPVLVDSLSTSAVDNDLACLHPILLPLASSSYCLLCRASEVYPLLIPQNAFVRLGEDFKTICSGWPFHPKHRIYNFFGLFLFLHGDKSEPHLSVCIPTPCSRVADPSGTKEKLTKRTCKKVILWYHTMVFDLSQWTHSPP